VADPPSPVDFQNAPPVDGVRTIKVEKGGKRLQFQVSEERTPQPGKAGGRLGTSGGGTAGAAKGMKNYSQAGRNGAAKKSGIPLTTKYEN